MPAVATIDQALATIDPAHEAQLRLYLELGGTVGEGSTMGPLLDRARLFAKVARPCTRCGGDVKRGIGGRGTVWAPGTGPAYASALKHEADVAAFLGLDPRRDVDPGAYGTLCLACKGSGWVPDPRGKHRATAPRRREGEPEWARGAVRELCTARMTGNSVPPWSGGPDPAAPGTLALLGAVSRRLLLVADRHAAVLCAYYLPLPPPKELGLPDEPGTGISETPRAVWPLTPAGRTMLKGYGHQRARERRRKTEAARRDPRARRAPPEEELSPWQVIAQLLIEQALRPLPGRARQMAAADAQAEELLAEARAAWRWAVAFEARRCTR